MEKKLFKLTIGANSKEEAENIAKTHDIEEILYTKEITRVYSVLTTKFLNVDKNTRREEGEIKP